MKKSIIFAATILLLTMVSCNMDSLTPSDAPLAWNGGTRAEKDLLDEIDFSTLDTAYFVTDKDVDAYVHFKELLAKGQGKEFAVQEVIPMGLNDEATLAYLLNYNEGWEIIAADKRAPVVLASGEEESFSQKEAPENLMAWIERLELDVLGLRLCKERPEWADVETWKEMLSSVDFWLATNSDENYSIQIMQGTRMINPDSLVIIDLEPKDSLDLRGHWEVMSIVPCNEVYSISHLTETQWGQSGQWGGYYFNEYCPLKSNGIEKAPAGCATVACAQLLYYLRNTKGFSLQSPSNAYCTANVNNVSFGTNMFVTGWTDSLWSSMQRKQSDSGKTLDPVAKLLAGTAIELNIQFSDTGGSCNDSKIRNFFYNKQIAFSESGHDANIILNQLNNSMPVLTTFTGRRITNNDIIGHAALIDCYKTVTSGYEYSYIWVYDFPSTEPRPFLEKTEFVPSGSPSCYWGLNWGWRGSYNDGWFLCTANWVTGDYEWPTGYPFDMFYGFSENN